MLQFIEAVLVRFGKFQDVFLSFSDGLQVIYGGNESGKSTIQLFLKVMLYGISGSKKDGKGIKLRERIIPWDDKSAEGILRLNLDGRCIEIRRKFGKTASGDKTEVVDGNTGDSMVGFDPQMIGEQLLGVPESVFERTLWLQQEGAFFSGADEEIHKRLMNLLETGEEEVSAEKTLQELEMLMRGLKAKDKRSNPGELDRLWSLREEKMQERYQLLSERSQREAEERVLKEEQKKLAESKQEEERLLQISEKKKKLELLDARRKKWIEAKRLLELAQQAKERTEYQRFLLADESLIQKAEKLEKRIEILDQTDTIEYDIEQEDKKLSQHQKRERQANGLLLLSIGFVVLAAIFAVIRISFWSIWTLIFGIAGILIFGFSFLTLQRSKKNIQLTNENRRRLTDVQSEAADEKKRVLKEYTDLLAPYHCKDAASLREGFLLFKQAEMEAEGYMRTHASVLEGEDIDTLAKEMEEIETILTQHADIIEIDVEAELRCVRQTQVEAISKIKENESKISYVYHGGKNPADVETEIQQINQQILDLEKQRKGLELAIEVLKEVTEKRKSDFTPQVNEKVNGFLDILTGGKYQDVRVSKELFLKLIPDKTHLYPVESFSTGTYEQVYFSLRLALASLLGNGSEPLFLDDFLVAYDDKRAEYAMELLQTLAENRQILFFSCHGREVKNAKKRNITVRYLEEEGNDGC